MFKFSLKRLWAMIYKEFVQMKRDHLTIGMLLGIPLMQLLLFGYAINGNPRHLPTVVVSSDHSAYTRTFLTAAKNTRYFRFTNNNTSQQKADKLLATGQAQFIITIPPDFTHKLIRGEKPSILITADGTDPATVGSAVSALNKIGNSALNGSLQRDGLAYLVPTKSPPYNLVVHAKYNPEVITQFNIVPGLMGVVLTMTMVIITALAITKEREFGTMEMLLSMPVRPIEVMIGKITPYIIMGYLQLFLIMAAAKFLFNIPIMGNIFLLLVLTGPFIIANLSIGLTFSAIAKNQLQAMQMAFFFFLPSIMLSGFMFPFYGMPTWAQWIGNILPLTHYLRIVRGIMLKGNHFSVLWSSLWPILVFMVGALFVGIKRYRQTLD